VIDPKLVAAIGAGERVGRRELLANSVQLWFSKIGKHALNPIGYGNEEIYAWGDEYDPKFLGIMAGVLKMDQIDRDGYAFV
jgi:hypothetical protein